MFKFSPHNILRPSVDVPSNVMIDLRWDPIDQNKHLQTQKTIEKLKKNNKQVYIAYIKCDIAYAHCEDYIHAGANDCIIFDFFESKTYHENVIEKKNKINIPRTIPTPAKFLFLNGSCHRLNRAPLFKKIVDQGLLEHSTYSFVYEQSTYNKQKMMSRLGIDNDAEYNDFMSKYNRTADVAGIDKNVGNHIYDIDIYANTDFSLVTETHYLEDTPDIVFPTEKTYQRIINQHPFVLASDYKVKQLLQDKGYRTFDEYLITEDTDVESAFENTKHWIKTLYRYEQQVKADTHHNKLMLAKNYVKTQASVSAFIERNNLNIDQSMILT